MCSIFGIFGLQPGDDIAALRRQALELSQKQRHRGPDWSGVYHDEGAILVHERLAIVDPAGGSQPLRSADGELVLAVNGEIYNHRELKAELVQDYAFQTGSDCEVINALYREDDPASFLNRLNGIFAFALWDKAKGRALIARDPIGVCPLYWGHDREGRLCVASEMKALAPICADVAQFPPGHYYDTTTRALVKYYQKPWRDYAAVEGVQVSKDELREAFERAVHRQLMTDVPYGVLLSGGLDSTVLLAHTITQGPTVALSVTYGQRHHRELDAAQAVAHHYRVDRHVLDLTSWGRLLVGSSLTDATVAVPHVDYLERLTTT